MDNTSIFESIFEQFEQDLKEQGNMSAQPATFTLHVGLKTYEAMNNNPEAFKEAWMSGVKEVCEREGLC